MTNRNDDLLVKMMVDLMKFPNNLFSPVERFSGHTKDFLNSNRNEFKDIYKNLEEEFEKMRNFHIVSTDIIEKEKSIVIKAEMPGFKKEDIEIEVENDFLVISAESKEENLEEGEYVLKEIRTGKFTKTFSLKGLNKDTITAKYEDGILNVEIQKLEKENNNKKIEIM